MLIWPFAALLTAQIALTLPGYCASPTALATYFFHHVIDILLFWSFLFITRPAEAAAHIGLVVGVGAHWLWNDNRCVLTEYMNSLCGLPRDAWLPSIKNMLGLRSLSEYFQFVWLGLHVGWDWRLLTR